MSTKQELETEVKLYRAGWREKTVEAVAAEVAQLRAVANIEFDRRFDTPEEAAAYQLGVRDVKQELRPPSPDEGVEG